MIEMMIVPLSDAKPGDTVRLSGDIYFQEGPDIGGWVKVRHKNHISFYVPKSDIICIERIRPLDVGDLVKSSGTGIYGEIVLLEGPQAVLRTKTGLHIALVKNLERVDD